jgi:hypothetical protein
MPMLTSSPVSSPRSNSHPGSEKSVFCKQGTSLRAIARGKCSRHCCSRREDNGSPMSVVKGEQLRGQLVICCKIKRNACGRL